MKYHFLPTEQHIDFGLGVTADSFKASALIILEKSIEGKQTRMDQLPLCYLFRHSIELYLKSMIIVLHTGLNAPFENKSTKLDPEILLGNKVVRLFSIHSIGKLYEYHCSIISKNLPALTKKAKTDWNNPPPDLAPSIKRIEENDSKSSYFRYPISNANKIDKEKSSFKKMKFEDIMSQMKKANSKPIKTFLLVDENDDVVDSFVYDNESKIEILDDLKYVSEMLSGACFGLRIELADGH